MNSYPVSNLLTIYRQIRLGLGVDPFNRGGDNRRVFFRKIRSHGERIGRKQY